MSEYIGRTALMGKLTAADMQQKLRQMSGEEAYSVLLWLVNDAPAADVAPVVHGKWNLNPDSLFGECSVCGYSCEAYSLYYCPACGAKMDGKGEEA